MKNPCVKDCPDRTIKCRVDCERYKPYRAWLDAQQKERQKRFLLDSFQIEQAEKTKRRTKR